MTDDELACPSDYERNYAGFLRLLADTKGKRLLIHRPQALGSTYAEIVESLNRVADAGKLLVIMPTAERCSVKTHRSS
jgi:hypothetical protein